MINKKHVIETIIASLALGLILSIIQAYDDINYLQNSILTKEEKLNIATKEYVDNEVSNVEGDSVKARGFIVDHMRYLRGKIDETEKRSVSNKTLIDVHLESHKN